MRVGVFDSGVGGQSVINAIKKELPELEIVYKDDKKHLPYGSKSVEEVHQFVRPIFKEFIEDGCQVIVSRQPWQANLKLLLFAQPQELWQAIGING
jgi:glutamate racemase